MSTAFTELVGCRLPVQLAPMGGSVGSPALAAAVSAGGGLGMLPAASFEPLDAQVAFVRARTDAPLGVGFFAFDLPKRLADLELASRSVDVVDLFWGEPSADMVRRIHEGGALAFWQVGSRDEAVAAADAGCDVVVAQGVEAGGHVRGTTPLRALLEHVLASVDVPVLAAGGIATGTRVAEVLSAGASGVRVGTRLLATTDSGAHPAYLQALLTATGEDTVLTTAFGADWPDAPHRVMSSALDAAAALPDQTGLSTRVGDRSWDVPRWSAQPPSVFCSGPVEGMAMYAGTGVGDVTSLISAAEALALLTSDA